jgi:hypothetical protein
MTSETVKEIASIFIPKYRFELIADYPDNHLKVGTILTFTF